VRSFSLVGMAGIALWAGSMARAQQQQPQQPQVPTTVQLPTFSLFTVRTTVSVPDRGGSYLGGLMRSREGSTTRGAGPLRNRGIGSERGASGMSAHATIIDNQAIDESLLAGLAPIGRPGRDTAVARAAELSRNIQSSSASSTGNIASIRDKNAEATRLRTSEAAAYFSKAQQAETENKPGLARIYYQMVLSRDAGHEAAQARLAALADGKAAAVAKR
jgi:hypothetical protein